MASGTVQAALWIAAWLVGVNAATMLAFGRDKRLAQLGQWRIPENTLLMLALLGGSPGALAARQIYRHKTRKQPFSTILYAICVQQAVLVVWLAIAGPAGVSATVKAMLRPLAVAAFR